MPPLPESLPLDPITLSNQKYTRSGELGRVLGIPLGSISEDHSFGVPQSKPMAPVASGELKHFKESVQDASKKAREVLNSQKRQRTDSPSDREGGVSLTKMGSQIHRSSNDAVIQRSEGKTTSSMTNKRIRTSGTDIWVENRSASFIRHQIVMGKDGNLTQTPGGGSLQIEKTRRLLAGGEGLDQKNKEEEICWSCRQQSYKW